MPSDFSQRLQEAARQGVTAPEERIGLNQYMELVRERPTIAASSYQRVYDLIAAQGVTPGAGRDEAPSYGFFADELFGLDPVLEKLVSYFESAGLGHETRKRILLLWGPPGGAKSTIAASLKRGLEAYSRTDEGAMYAIDGCPMHEEPLHLVPDDLRAEAEAHLGVRIEGQLCPVCRHRLQVEHGGDFLRMPLRRLYVSEAQRMAIGTFEPSDPKSMSIEQLTGGMDLKGIKEHGSDSHPLALDWAGEFSKANRGIFEAIEFLKNPREFLFSFLSLAAERQFKVPKFGYVSADFVIIGHCNEADFRRVMSDPSSEALRDRLAPIAVPYTVRLADERRIYEKLLHEPRRKAAFHVAPHALDAAATVAVLSRLTEHENLEPLEKLKLYGGEEVGDFKLAQVPEIRRAAEHEGMTGLGPRRIIDVLSGAATAQTRDRQDAPCLDPITTLLALRREIDRMEIPAQARDELIGYIATAREELDRVLKLEVQKAFVPAFAEKAEQILENYLLNVEAYLQSITVTDPITGEERDPDENLMRSIEEQIGVSDVAKDEFRQGVMVRIGMAARQGRPLTYRTDGKLGEAIEKRLFEEMRSIVRVTTSKVNPDRQQLERKNAVLDEMIRERGYCTTCASAVLDYVGDLLNR